MPNIIVTAFEPFNGRNTNISLEVLKNFKTNAIDRYSLNLYFKIQLNHRILKITNSS